MSACARPGCTAEGQPNYCSRRCSGIDQARKAGHAHYARIGALGRAAVRAKGRSSRLRPSELRLMVAGRYQEAADAIYDRAYGSGWMAKHTGRRQLPSRKASAA
jgi:hypothetical protein